MDASLSHEQALQRRAAVRHKLRLPVVFHWNDGVEHTGDGFTVDIALDGAFIRSSMCPPVGSNVRIEVLVPSPDGKAGEKRIESSGTVTRIVGEADSKGFGIQGVLDDTLAGKA
jgi:hypothetical protein